MDVERVGGGGVEQCAASVELVCFFDGVDRTYAPEVRDTSGKRFTFVCMDDLAWL
jgi:hypothetical protein